MADREFTCTLSHKTVNAARVAMVRAADRIAEIKAIALAAIATIDDPGEFDECDAAHLFEIIKRLANETSDELDGIDALSLSIGAHEQRAPTFRPEDVNG